MGAGTVLYATGRSKLTELGGLARAMPLALLFYMIGAFSISGVPLFSGFVSKGMVVHAAALGHQGIVFLLMNVASVGTFLSVGLKLPYFTWFGPDRSLKPAPVPWGMYLGMALTSGICIAIGVYPALLYNALPYLPVDYHPYTVRHLLESIQLLTCTGLGFWLVLKKLGAEATITLDIDWFYRRPARLANSIFVIWLSRLFGGVEGLAYRLVGASVRLGANPIGYLFEVTRFARYPFARKISPQPPSFDPDWYRFPVGVMVIIVLSCFAVIIAWNLFA
jgi:multicomponent Na+:H+ antiporter subunit D